MAELTPVINSIKDKHISIEAISSTTLKLLKSSFKLYLEDILGLQNEQSNNNGQLDGVMQLLIDIRKEAKSRKDYVTSDKIRNHLQQLGILLKDEKDGNMSYTFE